MKKNDGVSPVIGTILLVAITVVLVAIISAVVMGMTGNIGTSHVVGVNVVQGTDVSNNNTLLVTITGGETTSLSNITVYSGSNMVGNTTKFTAVGAPLTFIDDMYTTTKSLPTAQTSISVVGTFSDGNQTIYTGSLNIV